MKKTYITYVSGMDHEKFGSETPTLPELVQYHVKIEHSQAVKHRISKEFVKMWHEGHSLSEIARQYGKSRDMVRRTLKRAGIETNPTLPESKYTSWRKSGRPTAQPIFGYCYFQGRLVENPKEQQILLLIARLSKNGMNPNAIANYLNAKGYKPRIAEKWNRNSIILILKRSSASV